MTPPLAQWKPEYETGNPLVDQQHQSLFSIINALSNAMAEGQGQNLIEQTIQGVKEYTTIHFDTEEEYMQAKGYEGFEAHRKKHEALKAKFNHLEGQHYPDVNHQAIVLANFLATWLIQHIIVDDQRMITACRQAEQAAAAQTLSASVATEEITLAQWKPEYETGYVLIDDQHRSLFHTINALHSAILMGRGADLIDRTLKVLESYTTIHFATEENFMAQFNYPGTADHVEKHRLLRERVEVFLAQESSTDGALLARRLAKFLTNWLIHHIRDEDLKMINFLRQVRQQRPSQA